ncbi:response regulator transcription factor [Pseudoclavibacter sp. VKM Ac-2867]|uniref:response regulator transcription factor n=1 Tax=Pseudoclavibacter sp. VKM Ac-2867 TaxID=2783829 RepID=UPI00188BC522|nr:response regulator transcription factor [Pseudoclavibacter sp. VKM Ac-2867]MBF4460208.1 response regulator transcription factor [Pseudoclavibacter sp. VKM Ac-2867]
MIRILVADDHPIVRAGLVGIFEDEPDIEVVAEAANGADAVARATATTPAVVVMDLRMPGTDGVSATRQILAALPETRILVVTTYDSDDAIIGAIEAGASGYLLKTASGAVLVEAVRRVAAGELALAPSVTAKLVAQTRAAGAAATDGPGTALPPAGSLGSAPALSERELQVLQLVADGLSNPEIAVRLRIGEATVKTHLGKVFAKLEVNSRVRAVTTGLDLGLLRRS